MAKWILASSRKPKSGRDVLTFRPGAYYTLARGKWWSEADGGPYWSVEDDRDLYAVTHWMPFPKAPK